MKLFYFEARKMLLHQWGALILPLYLLLQLVMLMSGTVNNPDAILYQEGYYYYLEQVLGPYTEEKAIFLENEAERIAQAKIDLDTLYQEYFTGTVAEAELQTKAQEYQNILRYEDGFDVIYDQYLYICEGKENRCFLDTNGWTGLLDDGMLDLPLALAILLLVTPVFCSEYTCGMDRLALSTRNGRVSYVWHKILLSLLAVTILCLSGIMLQYGFYSLRYGLPYADYSIQSVEAFGNSTKQLTLSEAFCALAFLRLGGALFLTVIVMAVAAVSRQYAFTVLIPAASVLLPWIGLTEQMQYSIPLPLPFLLGVGFLQGSKTTTDTLSDELLILFQEMNTGDIIQLLALSAAVCILCLLVIRRRHRTVLSKSRHKTQGFTVLCLAAMLVLSGCSNTENSASEICFNSHTAITYETDNFRVYTDSAASQVENLETGEVVELIRNPLLDSRQTTVGKYLFGRGHCVYYTLTQIESYAGKLADSTGNVSRFSIIQVDLDTFEEVVVYEKQQVNTVLGVNINEGALDELYLGSVPFFLDDNTLYVIYGGVRCIDLRTGETESLDIPASSNVAFDGTYIYYIDERHALCKLEPASGELTRWTDIAAYDFCLNGSALYYIDMRHGNELYSMANDGTNRQLVLSEPLLAVEQSGNHLTITDQSGKVSSFDPEPEV